MEQQNTAIDTNSTINSQNNSSLLANFDAGMGALQTARTIGLLSDNIGSYIGNHMQSGLDLYEGYSQEEKEQFMNTYDKQTASYLLRNNKITASDYEKYTSLFSENEQLQEQVRQSDVATNIFMQLSAEDASPDEKASAIGQCMAQGVPLEKATQILDEIHGSSDSKTYNGYIAHALRVSSQAIKTAEGLVNTKYYKNNRRMFAKIQNSISEIDSILSGNVGQGFMDRLNIGAGTAEKTKGFFRNALPIKVISRLTELKRLLLAKKNLG